MKKINTLEAELLQWLHQTTCSYLMDSQTLPPVPRWFIADLDLTGYNKKNEHSKAIPISLTIFFLQLNNNPSLTTDINECIKKII